METTNGACQNKADLSFEWDFDSNIVLRVGGLHIPAVFVPELFKHLAELRLVGEKTGARSERLPSGRQADGGGLAQVFVSLGI